MRFLEDDKIYLRPVEENDAPLVITWLNDPNISRYTDHAIIYITEQEERRYLFKANNHNNMTFAIMSERHIGNIAIQNINWINRTASLSFLIGERNQGYGTRAGKLLVGYAFNQLNLLRLFLGTREDNAPMRKLALKLGFKESGRREGATFQSDRWYNYIEFKKERS